MNIFLSELNRLGDNEKLSPFGYNCSKGNEKLAYGYNYTPTEKKAREIAGWLLGKNIDSQILFVEKHKQFMVKIPFVNTYAADHFEMKKKPVELEESQALLCTTVQSIHYVWAEACSKVSRCLEGLFDCHEEYRKIRKQDLIQTTLFLTQNNYSNDPFIAELASHLTFDAIEMKNAVQNWCKNVKIIESELNQFPKLIYSQKKEGKTQKEVDLALLSFVKDKRLRVLKFCELTTSDIIAHTAAFKLDNLLYKQWLFLNKQIQSIKNYQNANSDPRYADLLQRCEEIKVRVMDVAHRARKKKEETPCTFFREETSNYLCRFLTYEVTEFEAEEKEKIDREKNLTEKIVIDNAQDISELRSCYERLKEEITKLAHEIFAVIK